MPELTTMTQVVITPLGKSKHEEQRIMHPYSRIAAVLYDNGSSSVGEVAGIMGESEDNVKMWLIPMQKHGVVRFVGGEQMQQPQHTNGAIL